MDFYWIYDIPSFAFFCICVGFFIAFALLGAFIFSSTLETKLNLTVDDNSIVATFLSLSGVFYGITLGLIAVATFENFNSVSQIVNDESSALAALYRDVSILEKNDKEALKKTLKEYTTYVVEKAWPAQRKGTVPKGGTALMDTFQYQFANYIPVSDKDKIIYAEVFDQFNVLIEKRRLRLNAVTNSLPSTVWTVLMIGALINIMLTWFLVVKNKKLDIAINILTALLLGSLIFLIAAMDNPFRGDYSVGSESFQLLLDGMMK
jgi:hypothetical protein